MPALPAIIVLNHHRIGDATTCEYDRGVISASAADFERQVEFIKDRFPVIGVAEMVHLLRGGEGLTRTFVMWTFDDGYIDNYEVAFPILQAYGCTATFFLATELVGSTTVPWWDEIAYLIRRTEKEQISLDCPSKMCISFAGDREAAIRAVLRCYKATPSEKTEEFMAALRSELGNCVSPEVPRFLNWEQARRMVNAGMELGSHTCSHPVLGQTNEKLQQAELTLSRECIQEQTGASVRTIAYPVGSRMSFSETTQMLAREAGYAAAFSFYGGVNRPTVAAMDVKRMEPSKEFSSFCFETLSLSRFGRLPY